MRLARIRHNDVVECDVKGRRFFALAGDREGRELRVRPITHNISYSRVTGPQVIAHFRRQKAV